MQIAVCEDFFHNQLGMPLNFYFPDIFISLTNSTEIQTEKLYHILDFVNNGENSK